MTKKDLNQNAKYDQELINIFDEQFIFGNKPINRFNISDNINTPEILNKPKRLSELKKEISSIDLKSCNVFRLTDEQISNLENIKYIFSEKDKLARFNPDNVLLKNVDHEKDIVHLEDVGHFPYFEDKQLISETLVKLINS